MVFVPTTLFGDLVQPNFLTSISSYCYRRKVAAAGAALGNAAPAQAAADPGSKDGSSA